MNITETEIIDNLSFRYLNSKTNNYIITNVVDFDITKKIPDICKITFTENDLNIDIAKNVKIDLKKVNIHNLLKYVLELINIFLDCNIDFNNKFDLIKFQGILRNYNKVVQIICTNIECLSKEEQMLLNELYYFNSPFYNITTFVNQDFSTYFLSDERVLDNRENYTK